MQHAHTTRQDANTSPKTILKYKNNDNSKKPTKMKIVLFDNCLYGQIEVVKRNFTLISFNLFDVVKCSIFEENISVLMTNNYSQKFLKQCQ